MKRPAAAQNEPTASSASSVNTSVRARGRGKRNGGEDECKYEKQQRRQAYSDPIL